ncbi:hypothetical protein GCM10027610_088970 [Dactylosporangium cerinum]
MRIVIAEDLLLLREGMVRLLTDTGHTVVAAVDTAPALLDAAAEHRPDLCVVDVRLPRASATKVSARPCGCVPVTRRRRC